MKWYACWLLLSVCYLQAAEPPWVQQRPTAEGSLFGIGIGEHATAAREQATIDLASQLVVSIQSERQSSTEVTTTSSGMQVDAQSTSTATEKINTSTVARFLPGVQVIETTHHNDVHYCLVKLEKASFTTAASQRIQAIDRRLSGLAPSKRPSTAAWSLLYDEHYPLVEERDQLHAALNGLGYAVHAAPSVMNE